MKSVHTGKSNAAKSGEEEEPPSPDHQIFDQTERESKFELYEYDSLVDIGGLQSMRGQQTFVTSIPTDGHDVAISLVHPRAKGAMMGTLMGVFIPCLQNILGIIFYIRFSWIVGIAGIAQSLMLVSLCCLCTFLTGLSLSAIATNGAMKGGGPYYLISRALGPEVGISIGLCFFLGNAVAGSLYILGAVETFLDAIPGAGIFRESTTRIYAPSPSGAALHAEVINSPNLHDLQIYGVITTVILCLVVFGGVKIVNKVGPAFLVPVLLSVFLIFIGIFAASHRNLPSGITGLRWNTLKSNWGPEYQHTNRAGIPAPDGIIYWNFEALLGLFFPAATGIMAGSNRSASLKDTQRSIPIGTLAAIGSTTILYLVSVFMFGAVATRKELLTNRLLTATVAWPAPAVVQIGIILSTLGAALQSLTDAPSWRPRWKFHHWSFSLAGALLCIVIMLLISWAFTIVSLALASLIYYYVSIRGKAGDWGDGFKSAYFQLALRSLRSLGGKPVHPKNWYPIPLIFCKPWGILPPDVPCHPKLADFANCMRKKGRGMSMFVSIMEGNYRDKAREASEACRRLNSYIEYKNCEGVAEVLVAKSIPEGFRGIVQTMGLANLKPNIVCMRYPEIWRDERHTDIPDTFVNIIKDCSVANKAVVIVKGLDEWPNEYQKQYGSIDLYWIVRDGGLMLLLSQLLQARDSFESCTIQVFCIAEEDTEAEELKKDVKKFLYDLRMQAEVFVVTMKSWEAHQEDSRAEMTLREDAMDAFSKARKRIAAWELDFRARHKHRNVQNISYGEQQVDKFLYTTLKLNNIIRRYSQMAAVVLVSLPPPPPKHPSYFYMEYMDLLVERIPRLLMVRGYRRDVITIFT